MDSEEMDSEEEMDKYYYTDRSMDCDGWAVIKGEGGEVLSCHRTEREAVQALVAACAQDKCRPGGYWEGPLEADGEEKPKLEIKVF